jgi:hypothetical protein
MLKIVILTTRRRVGPQMGMSKVRTPPAPRDQQKRTVRANTTISTGWGGGVVLPLKNVVVTICIILCRTLGFPICTKRHEQQAYGRTGIQPKNQRTGNPPFYSLKGKTPLRYRILPLLACIISLALRPSSSGLTELNSTTSISPGLTTYVPAFSPSTISTSDPRRFLTTPSVLG